MLKNSSGTGAEKQEWSSKWTFIFAAVSSAVGLGNIWRFPFTAHQNGGGAFIIPYFIAILVMGIPLMILEFAYGSRLKGTTPLAMARAHKKWEILGWIPTLAAGMIIFYYGVILVWAMRFAIFAADKSWGTETGYFFQNTFLRNSGNALHLNRINMGMFIGLVVLWGVSYLVLSKGIKKGLERVNRIVLPLMFLSALALIVRGVTLDNAYLGLNALFTPDFSAMLNPNVWLAAFGQAMFSLSLCMGIMVTYSSYMKKGTEMVNTTYMVAIVDVGFAFLFSVGIFAIIGYLVGAGGADGIEAVGGGAGLVFVTLPIAFNYMGGMGYAMGVAFFIMLAVSGWTSFLSLLEAFVAPFTEKFGWSRVKAYRIVMGVGFVISLLYATDAASPILGLVDWTVNNFWLPLVGILQAILAAWVIKKVPVFQKYVNVTTLPFFRAGTLWTASVKFIIPIMGGLVFTLAMIAFFTGNAPAAVAGSTTPEVAVFVGGTLLLVGVISFVLSKLKWVVSVDDYEKPEGDD